MGLETGNFIPELVDTNPIGATDTVAEGDNHLRLIKRALLGSFPGFVGTTGTPKSVTLTEDEINALIDAALKSNNEVIIGDWIFQGLTTFEGLVIFEDAAGNPVGNTDTIANGSMLIEALTGSARKAGFRNPLPISVGSGDAVLQEHEGQIVQYSGAAGPLTVNSLEAGTAVTLLNSGLNAVTLTEGTAGLNWVDGSGAAVAGNRTIAANSVVQLYWQAGVACEIWGNGIT